MLRLVKWTCSVLCALLGCLVSGDAIAQDSMQVRGLLQAIHRAELSSEIAAPVRNLPFREGEAFKKGDLLVAFDCRVVEAHYRIAQANYRAAQKMLDNKNYLQKLNSVGELEVVLAQTDLQKAQGELKAAAYEKDQCQLEAPYAGRVVASHVQMHESVAPGDPLLEILDDSSLEIALVVPSQWLSWLEPGQEFDMVVDETGETIRGKIIRFGAVVDPVSQTVGVIGALADPKQQQDLISGMSGTAHFNALQQDGSSSDDGTGHEQ